jgi:membrane-bound ClpP family serine protease
MRSLFRSFRSLMTVAIAMALMLTAAPGVFAKDVVHLKDGTVLEGTIKREVGGAIFLVINIGDLTHEKIIPADDIKSIERDIAVPGEEQTAETPVIPAGATKIAFITLEEMVGPFFNAKAIEHSVGLLDELPEEQRPDIIVFQINSGGGALIEQHRIIEYLRDEVKPRYRAVAWIDSAISAAAMSAWVLDEIYMMKQGNIGACTGFRNLAGGTEAMEGVELERELMWMEQVSGWGKRDPYIMRAMQVYMTLSADIEEDGDVIWYDDDSGEYMVSPQDQILTFHSHDAVKFGVAEAVVDTKEELARALGCEEWVEVGFEADEYQQEFRENVGRAQVKLSELGNKLQLAVSAAQGAPSADERNRQVGVARRYLREMKGWINRAPSLENPDPWPYSEKWFRDIDRQLRDLAR